MKVQITEESPIRRRMEIALGAEAIRKYLDAAYREIGKSAKLKGFRPGKVPRPVLEKYYRPDAEERAVRALVETSYPEALVKEKIHPVSQPQIQLLSFAPDKELKYAASFEVRPAIAAVKGYQGMKLTQPKGEVSDQEVVDRIKAYQEAHAKLVPIAPPRALAAGDVVLFDYEALREGQPFEGNEVQGYMAEIGKGVLMADFEKELKKLKPGEQKVIDVTFPPDFADKNFAGKKMTYTVTLREAKQKVVPKADDDFAKDLGAENLPALNEKVRVELKQAKEQAVRSQLHHQVVDQLMKSNELLLPEGMVASELSSMWNQAVLNLQRQRLTPEKVGLTPENFRERNQDFARKRVAAMLFFEAIWKAEGLTVTQEEREQKMEALAKVIGQVKAAVIQYYQQDATRLQHLDALILEDKTLDFILGQAKIKTEDVQKT